MLVLWVGGQWLLGDAASELTIGVLTAFMLFITRFFEADPGPHDAIRRAASSHGRGRAHFRPPGRPRSRLADRPNASTLPAIQGHIEFDHVRFGYHPQVPVFEDLSFTTSNPGDRFAFVGRTGAGKSTIIRLLMRFYDVDSRRRAD